MPEAYAGSLTVPNDYRCFVLDPHITQPTYMTGYQVTPDQVGGDPPRPDLPHRLVAGGRGRASVSGSDGKPGLELLRNRRSPDDEARFQARNGARVHRPGRSHRGLGARPGPGRLSRQLRHPDAAGRRARAAGPLPLRHDAGRPTARRSSIQTDPGTDNFKQHRHHQPDRAGRDPVHARRERAAVRPQRGARRRRQAVRPHRVGRGVGLLGLCGKTADELAANFQNGVASTSCDYTVPESGTIVSVFGHEHTLGKTFRFTLDPDTAEPDRAARHPDDGTSTGR